MAWVRIDDHFYDHPKWATAPGDSIALWLAAMAWCNRAESYDGYIPAVKLGGLVNVRNAKATAADLVKREAFIPHLEGYLIKNYSDWQQNEKVKAIRQKRSDSGKKGAAVRWGNMATGMANAITSAIANEPETGESEWQTDGNTNAHRPLTTDHSAGVVNDLDDSMNPDATVVGRVFAIYAEHVYRRNPSACTGDPERYMAGIAKNARTEKLEPVLAYMRQNPTASAKRVARNVLRVPADPAEEHNDPNEYTFPMYYYDPACTEHGSDGLANFAPEGAPAEYGPCRCQSAVPYPQPPLADVIEFTRKEPA